MKSKDDFIAKWRMHVAGLAVYGITSDVKDTTMTKVERLWKIPAMTEDLLAEMYEWVAQEASIDELAHVVIKMYAAAPPDVQKRIVDLFREAFTKKEKSNEAIPPTPPNIGPTGSRK